MLGDDKDSEDLNVFLNAIGGNGDDEEAPTRISTSFNDIDFLSFDEDSHNPFQDCDSSPINESPPKVYIAPRVMISHQDSFSEDSRIDVIEDARIFPNSPRLRVPSSPRAFVYPRSVESPRFGSPVGVIDTASPFESVKEAVSKFGGITDWKAHKIQTIERRKLVDEELEKIQEAMPEYKREAELAEEAKHDALKELENTKGVIEELKLELEKAQKEEEQAKQDSELAQMRVEEMEKGVANEASVAVKAQLEVAKARQVSATCELRSVREEIEMVSNEYEDMLREKDLAAERADIAVMEAKEIERTMDGLSIELIATKEELESVHTAHLEAEEKRFSAAMARDQDVYNWEKELKMVEADIERLNQEVRAADDVKHKLETASTLQNDLKAELAALMEYSSCNLLVDNSNNDIHAAVDSAKRELEEVKSNIEKAASEVKTLKIIAGSLQSELGRERQDLVETKQRESAGLVRKTDKETRDELVETAKKLEQATKEAEDAKSFATAARDELRMAKELSEQAKQGMSTIESKLTDAKKEMEAARASEKLALAAIKALQETESSQRFEEINESPRSIIISVEEYYELSKQAHESEEEANTKLSEIVSQIEVAKEEESRILEKLEEVNREMEARKEELKEAMGKAEKARDGKLGMEQELRKWRSENGKRRTDEGREAEKSPTRSSTEGNGFGQSKSFAFGEQGSSSNYIAGGTTTTNTTTNNNNLTPETKKKKKKLSLFPKVFMFLSRRKSHSHK